MIHEILLEGQENAMSGRQICALLHLSARDVTKAVEVERRAGYPICASTDAKNPGYYLAQDKGEMERFCERLQHRAGEIHKTRRACLATLPDLPESEVS